MRLARYTVYTMRRVPDGAGGFSQMAGYPRRLYAALQVHENETFLVCRAGANVSPEDVAVIGGGNYRIVGDVGHTEGPMRRLLIERIERPIVPLEDST